ncbi:RHS repeat domain-containing protein [Yersinia alsatica]|uniref:RHS repeat domain-containing protein n=1 Tax=Yersinia alsatica TaxID=2890317 RepID=UPI001F18F875|nr:RHS repeat-associated core domain-containing protein [Yersinia alsatica]
MVFYDIEGRPVCQQTANKARQRFEYEDQDIGRLLSRHEQLMAAEEHITDQYVYAKINDDNKSRNRCGQLIIHYDTAGVLCLYSNSLTGATLLQERQLLTSTHHPASRLDATKMAKLPQEPLVTRHTLGALGQLLTQTDARNNRRRYRYNRAGQLANSWLQLNEQPEKIVLAAITYSATGQVQREESGNGVVTEYTYEPQTQRLTGIKTTRPAHILGPKVLQDLRYDYDPVGNILSIRNDAEATRFFDQKIAVPESTYSYDALYQLIRATGNESTANTPDNLAFPPKSDATQIVPYIRDYAYDEGGNLTAMQHTGIRRYTREFTLSTRNNHGRLTSARQHWSAESLAAQFDNAGNQLSLDNGIKLKWNGKNQLIQSIITANSQELYIYDSDSMRVVKRSIDHNESHQVIYLPGIELHSKSRHGKEVEVWQVISCGASGRAQVRALHWEQGKPNEIYNNQLCYSFDNQIGSSLLELDETAQIISQEDYFPYGGTALFAARSKIEAGYKTIRYSGKERDATGLYYYGYRYYIPWAGRWLSTDPTGFVDGLNLFRMVRNNPILFYDLLGDISEKNRRRNYIIDSYTRMHEIKKSAKQQIEIIKSGGDKLALRAAINFTADLVASGINMGMAMSMGLPGSSIIAGLPGTIAGDITNRTIQLGTKKLVGGPMSLGLNYTGSTDDLNITGSANSYTEAFSHEHTFPFGSGEIKSVIGSYEHINAAVNVYYNRGMLAKKLYEQAKATKTFVLAIQNNSLNIINRNTDEKYNLSLTSRLSAWNNHSEYPKSIVSTILHKNIDAESVIIEGDKAISALTDLEQLSRSIGYPAIAWGEAHLIKPPSSQDIYTRRKSSLSYYDTRL